MAKRIIKPHCNYYECQCHHMPLTFALHIRQCDEGEHIRHWRNMSSHTSDAAQSHRALPPGKSSTTHFCQIGGLLRDTVVEGADIGPGDVVLYPDGKYWKVTQVNLSKNQVHLSNRSNNTIEMRTVEWCVQNKV